MHRRLSSLGAILRGYGYGLASLFALSLNVAQADPAHAKTDCDHHRVAEFAFAEENDVFVPFEHTDGDYTQGLRFNWSYVPGCAPKWMGEWGEKHLPSLGESLRHLVYEQEVSADVRYAVEFGHMIFTPNDINESQPILDDRPYAGLLFGGLSYAIVDNQGNTARRQHQFELQLGVVGPISQAEQSQKIVHSVMRGQQPHGWDNQVRNEPVMQFNYTFQRRFVSPDGHFDVIPGVAIAAGSVFDYAAINGVVRVGTKNMRGFPVSNIRASAADAARRGPGDWELYVYAGVEGRGVYHNLFLDGNNFVESQYVEKKPFVYDLKLGGSLRYGAFRLSYSYIRRSREFYPDVNNSPTGGHGFGCINIAWEPKI